MKLYLETKEAYKDCILFYRLGDFYEMFFDDAILVSKELELTLTGKSCGLEERAPMCGVPFHAADVYINRLIANGHKVAICEQVEDPKQAKGLVKREVIRIVTPGTNIDMESLDDTRNNYIMCVVCLGDKFGLSIADITTGEFRVTEVESLRKLTDELFKFSPKEIICNEAFQLCGIDTDDLQQRLMVSLYPLESWYFDDESCVGKLKSHFQVDTLDGFGLKDYSLGTIAAGSLLQYLYETQKNSLSHMRILVPYDISSYMVLDSSSRRNLELTETIRDKQKKGSLLWVLDKTKTAMGSRMLRAFIEQPLIDKKMISDRLDHVEAFIKHPIGREEMREYLDMVYDLERLMTRISYRSANPRDLLAFRQSVSILPHIREILKDFPKARFMPIYDALDPLKDLFELIDLAIDEDAPLTVREGGIIKKGYNETIDQLRNAKTEGKQWLADLEEETRKRTGIKNLRVRYNKVFGYYFEVTNSFKDLVPEDFIRKQTLTNAERYTTDRLKELEDTILNAEDKLFALEYDLFSEIRDKLSSQVDRIQKTAHIIAMLDTYASLAKVSEQNHYVRPKLNEKGLIKIKGGRHPVVEKITTQDLFVQNDTYLDNTDNMIAIITGPNMAGKSTYMRMSALIVLMAQIGCFVPADEANIGIVDRIFTRVGASDDLASGQSTFMVEMTEVANILRNATQHSLLILDEIGRGTSTFDGLSIAWAVIEYISKVSKAKTLFATHYHELTELEGTIKGLNNYCIAVKEEKDHIIFLRKVIRGGADKSYGIQVAKLAGVPDAVIDRAKELVQQLGQNDIARSIQIIAAEEKNPLKVDEVDLNQMSLFDTVKEDDIIDEILRMNIDQMTPMEALNTLSLLQSRLKNRW